MLVVMRMEEQNLFRGVPVDLPKLEAKVLALRYARDCSFVDIGRQCGISAKEATRIHDDAGE